MFNHHSTSLRYFMVMVMVVLMLSVFGAAPAGAWDNTNTNTQFSGQATGVKANVLGFPPITLSDTGPLPPAGGNQEASLLSANVPGLLTANVFHSSTIGQGDRSRSEASVANFNLTVAGNVIGADFLMSRAMAVCGPNGSSSVSGGSEIAALVINGQTITVSGQPNQTIDLPLGTGKVIINEQYGNSSDITVNALRVIVYGIADVIVASAHADVKCGSSACDSAKDFVTGGGWIDPLGNGSKANFAVAGGIKNGFWGHLQYIDHGTGMKVKGTGVTAYVIMAGRLRHIEGTCEINGASGYTYKADLADNGEPGRDVDTFSLALSNGYSASRKLAGGNIQLHKLCQ
jgi:hypothetical protein